MENKLPLAEPRVFISKGRFNSDHLSGGALVLTGTAN
jgi:hypothetical protein